MFNLHKGKDEMINSLSIETTLLFTAAFGVLHVIFTLRVGLFRLKNKVSLGDGGDSQLHKLIRGQGNFTENVPIGLIIILLNELNGLAELSLSILAGTFLVARAIHYCSIVFRLPFIIRPLSMIATMGSILVGAILLVL